MDNRIIYLCSLSVMCTISAPPQLTIPTQRVTVDPQGQPVTVEVYVQPTINVQPKINVKPDIHPENLFQPDNTINTNSTNHGGAAIAQSKSNATNTTMNKIKLYLSQKLEQIKTISPRLVVTLR